MGSPRRFIVLRRPALLLGRLSLMRRACPVKRAASDRVEWRDRTLYAGGILTAAVGKCRPRTGSRAKECDAQRHDENYAQVDLLLLLARN